MISDYENLPNSTSRMKKLLKLIAVSFGLLCVLQATVNISLRLAPYNSEGKTSDTESLCKNLTEERDELSRMLSDCDNKSLDLEDRFKILIKERDELKAKLTGVATYNKQGWVYFSDSVYYISTKKKNWQDSRKDCLQKDADLIIINSKEEQDLTRHLKHDIWIGLTDTETEGTWKWVDGTPLNTSYWMDLEPNSYENTEEDCAEVKFNVRENNWNDIQCDDLNIWICEKKLS